MESTILQTHGPSAALVIAVDWIPLFIGLAAILARLHWRFNITRQKLSTSDVCLCLAWCAAAANASFDIFFLRIGALAPNMDYTLTAYQGTVEEFRKLLKAIWVNTVFFITTFYLCKAALLSFYLQVLPSSMRSYRIVILVTVAYTAIAYTVSIFLTFFLCLPVQRNWALDSTACAYEAYIIFLVAWALHFSSDIVIFLLPFPILHRLKVHKAVRIGAYCTFGLGAVNISVCLARFLVVYLSNAEKPLSLTLLSLWSNLDASTSVLIACLPSLRPYLRIVNQALSSRSRSSRASGPARTKLRVFSKTGPKSFERIEENMSMKRLASTEDNSSTKRLAPAEDEPSDTKV